MCPGQNEEREHAAIVEDALFHEDDVALMVTTTATTTESDEELGDVEEDIALVSRIESNVNVAHEWYIDSGASKHMTHSMEILSNAVYYEKPSTVVVLGDKSIVLAYGEGQLRLRTACPGGTCLALKKVLFVDVKYVYIFHKVNGTR